MRSLSSNRRSISIAAFGLERSYFLYNAHCVFRLANSEVDGVCRFVFEGGVHTDAGDRKCERTMLDVRLTSQTWHSFPLTASTASARARS